jgi:hypothetical protein
VRTAQWEVEKEQEETDSGSEWTENVSKHLRLVGRDADFLPPATTCVSDVVSACTAMRRNVPCRIPDRDRIDGLCRVCDTRCGHGVKCNQANLINTLICLRCIHT